MANILVVYYSGTGNTRAMADAVVEGANQVAGVEVILKEAEQTSVDDLVNADALAFGSPTHFSYMAGVLKAMFDKAYLSRSRIRGKPFVAFASGGGGEAKGGQSIESIAASCGLQKVCEGLAVGGMPTDSERQVCRRLGASLAKAIAR